MRHGESEANVQRRFANRVEAAPLTVLGREQVARLADRLAAEVAGRRILRLLTSPLLRARQSAEILGDRLGVRNVSVAQPLVEFDVGVLEGTSDPQGWKRLRPAPCDWFLTGATHARLPGGESRQQVLDRAGRYLREALAWPQIARPTAAGAVAGPDPSPEPGTVGRPATTAGTGAVQIAVSHGGVTRCCVPALAVNVTDRFACENHLPTTAWVELSERRGSVQCLRGADQPLDIG